MSCSFVVRRINEVPEEYFSSKSTVPMDGSVYVSSELHQAYHHYLKVCMVWCAVVELDSYVTMIVLECNTSILY